MSKEVADGFVEALRKLEEDRDVEALVEIHTEEGAALEWTTEGTSNGEDVSYGGVSILEIEGGKVRRFMAYFDTRDLTPQVVDRRR
jgi:ketosteroid isomerase-like protein